MSVRTQENLSNEGRDNRYDRWRLSQKDNTPIDLVTTVEPEPHQVTLARVPKCCQEKGKNHARLL